MRSSWLLVVFASLLSAQSGEFKIHMILHAIGQERYKMVQTADEIKLNTTIEFTDRSTNRRTSATLRMRTDYTPFSLTFEGKPDSVGIEHSTATVEENGIKRTLTAPARYFTIFGSSPFAIQMMMLRYWKAHGRSAGLPMVRASAAAEPIQIKLVGRDSVVLDGKRTSLKRYIIANLVFGREIVWMSSEGDLIAAMTFAGSLPMEALRAEYESVLPQLYRSGVAQQMADLQELARQVRPERSGAYAIAGAKLVDATGAPPLEESVVLIRDGRITAAGSRASVRIPPGMRTVEATGLTLLPGLWEMHIHASGVEFGPALLAAGITTARDCGGEFDYLVAQRDLSRNTTVPSPRMLLAGLVDAGGLQAFGHVTAETEAEGRAVVDRYHAAGFQQIKLYTYLQANVIRAICAEAHRLGMTVTGHVPKSLDTFGGIDAGMDQINHLNYISNMLREPGDTNGAIDLNSAAAERAIAFLRSHHTVVDPTAGWGEMASHSKETDVASFEPGILLAPFVLNAKFRGMATDVSSVQTTARVAQNLQVIGALHKAGIPIVPGSDTGLPGYGLLREIELYVQAGFTPLEAIQSATIVSARAMGLDRDSGTIEPGKRADLILVAGNPLANISDLRQISQVVVGGHLYRTAPLWQSVGFRPPA